MPMSLRRKMRSLDFSQFLNPQTAPNGKVVVIRDPRSGAPFPNNVIPFEPSCPGVVALPD